MRVSQLHIPTLRNDPANADVASHRLLLRAGFIQQVASGLFTWLPLGLRVLQKVEHIVREELNRFGGQEVLMPVVQPANLWQESGRWDLMGDDLLRMVDRHDNDFCFSPTHEEVVTDLVRQSISSYRDLPTNLYQINTKFRDEIRPRFGLMRAREFIMKDGYSFHLNDESLDEIYQSMRQAYQSILSRIGVDYRVVKADSGVMGGSDSEEFHILASSGEDTLAYSPASEYAANVEQAESVCHTNRSEPTEELKRVATPGLKTIDEVSDFLKVSPSNSVKTLIVHGDDSLIALILRGDHQLNEFKAAHIEGVTSPLTFANNTEIKQSLDVQPGSIGPVNLPIRYIVDRHAAVLNDFVCGANEDGVHYQGVNWERDASITEVADLRIVEQGDVAPDGSGDLEFTRGIEVGHIFKLGRKYTDSLNATVQTKDGGSVNPTMGCYGFGVSRTVAAVVEQCSDERGIVWPKSIAPALIHIVSLNQNRSEAVLEQASKLYDLCMELGVEALWDDREVRPGVKFNDADLIGLPYRVTIGERGLKDGTVEFIERGQEREAVDINEIPNLIRKLQAETQSA